MASVVLNGSVSGSCTITTPSAAGTTTLTLPASTGTVMVNGPAFSAYLGSNQSVSASTYTKVQCNTEEFDTNSNYDNATNYRFTPTVAGYYQINGSIDLGTSSISAGVIKIYKNGSGFKNGANFGGGTSYTFNTVVVSALVYLNGSTDYVELYGYVISTTPLFYNGAGTYLQASLVRGA